MDTGEDSLNRCVFSGEETIDGDRYNFKKYERKRDGGSETAADIITLADDDCYCVRTKVLKGYERLFGMKASVAAAPKRRAAVDFSEELNAYGEDALRWALAAEIPERRQAVDLENGLTAAYRLSNRIFRLRKKVNSGSPSVQTATALAVERLLKNVRRGNLHNAGAAICQLAGALGHETQIAEEDYRLLLSMAYPLLPHLCKELLQRAGLTVCVLEPMQEKEKNK